MKHHTKIEIEFDADDLGDLDDFETQFVLTFLKVSLRNLFRRRFSTGISFTDAWITCKLNQKHWKPNECNMVIFQDEDKEG